MAKKKIDPLNRKQYGAVSAALTVTDHSCRGQLLPEGIWIRKNAAS